MRRHLFISGLAIVTALSGATMWKLTWSDRHAMTTPVAGGAAGQIDGRLIYAGGTTWTAGVKHWLRDVAVYDPSTDRWIAGPALPAALAYGAVLRSDGALEILGGSGGQNTSRECWRLASVKGPWQRRSLAPVDTLLGRAELVAGRAWLFGGCADVADLTRCSDSVWRREADGMWQQAANLPQGALAMPAAAAVGSRVYLFGGCSMKSAGALVNRDDAYSFDTGSRKWARLRSLPHANRGMTAAALDDRHILLAGGYTATQAEAAGKPADFGFTAAVWLYDTQTDTYREASALPYATSGVELVVQASTIFAMGGEHRMRDRSNRLLVAPMPTAALP